MTTPFDYINSVSHNKVNMMQGTPNDALAEKGYNAYLVNMGLSYFPDTIEYANMMNRSVQLDNKLQYSFFLNILRPKKRFAKWVKKHESADIEIVKAYYKCNNARANEYVKILTKDQIKELETRTTVVYK
jgi:hypothetical protein